jgi:hypothetical protein
MKDLNETKVIRLLDEDSGEFSFNTLEEDNNILEAFSLERL